MRALPFLSGACLALLAACAQSPVPSPAASESPPRYVLPNASLLPEYRVAQAVAVADPSAWVQFLGVAPARYENHIYKTRNDTHLNHIEILDFAGPPEARRAYSAYPNYLATYTPCENRRSLDLGFENFACDNAGQLTSEFYLVVALAGSRIVAAHTHDPVSPPADLVEHARRTLKLLT